jgi:hypothetical protein
MRPRPSHREVVKEDREHGDAAKLVDGANSSRFGASYVAVSHDATVTHRRSISHRVGAEPPRVPVGG